MGSNALFDSTGQNGGSTYPAHNSHIPTGSVKGSHFSPALTHSFGSLHKERIIAARPFDIVHAEVPFSNCCGSKWRPFLIWRDFGLDWWGFPLTKHDPRNRYEIPVADWQLAGLRRPGSVRMAAACPVAKECVEYVIGTISKRDAAMIVAYFGDFFETGQPEPMEQDMGLTFA